MKPKMIPLVAAALKLGRTYHQTLALVLAGRLRGFQGERRHWWVEEASVREFARERVEVVPA